MERTILGLDLGTNSVGWALVKQDFENQQGEILGIGSRIIPMSQDLIGDFNKGNSISQTAERTRLRGTRRLLERHLLRRERLHRVLHVLGFLPQHYAAMIDFEQRKGKFLPETETKLVYSDNGFIFMDSFKEMLAEFKEHQPDLVANGKKIPYDWTIYYLRKKALKEKIENEELAWLLLHFNQKRGYYQLRGEETDEKPTKTEEFQSLKIIEVTADEPKKGETEIWYRLTLENGLVYPRKSKVPLFDWKDKVRDFIVTTEIKNDGTLKHSFRSPKDDDWGLKKKKTEADVVKFPTVGLYIYEALLKNPGQKIVGGLVKTIERKFYKEELNRIMDKQCELNPSLLDTDLYKQCIEELYPHNLNHRSLLENKDFLHLFIEDILFYQRPLKSQKSSISDCPLEYRTYMHEGVKKKEYLKCIPKSHPLFQEFRLWQWIANFRIYSRKDDADVTGQFIKTPKDIADLFSFLNKRKEIDQKTLFSKLFNIKDTVYRWNYVEDKKYPCNETRSLIETRLAKLDDVATDFLTPEREEALWHIIYSVVDKIDYEKALRTFALKNGLNVDAFFEAFRKFPPFPSNYGAYSAKAIKKLLPLMRTGKYWSEAAIDPKTMGRIEKLVNGEFDESIRDRVRNHAIKLTETANFQGLQEWLAKYVVYDRHAEGGDTGKWKTVEDLEVYLKQFRQHSLKNPIVEQVMTETLRTVKDIWAHFGNGSENFFDEIHIELAREMKKPAKEREQLSNHIIKNENTNLRIKLLLAELGNDPNVENVRPYSPMQQEILKIYEETALTSLDKDEDLPDDIEKISRLPQPSSGELQRYKLWLEQRYKSPYTGAIIPLNKLFTPAYEIEHIIPQSRFFDDSLGNKVICESAVNKLKDNRTALEFIQAYGGSMVDLGMNQTVPVMKEAEFTEFVKQHYDKNRGKKNRLLTLDIPEKMIERQLNDTRYISKFIMTALSNMVRSETNDDGVNSKNVIPCNGQITGALKRDWGLDGVWNDLILPRFERLNVLTGTTDYTVYNERHQKLLPTVPLIQMGFQKKRIDHRHHAMDAFVVACATRSHINFLNNQNALDKTKSKQEKQTNRHDLKVVLCDKKYDQASPGNYNWVFKQPWKTFVPDAKAALEGVVVSFKQNLRIINKTVNLYEKIVDGKKVEVKQVKGENWAVRKSLHKDTVFGAVSFQYKKTVSLSAALDTPDMVVDKAVKAYLKAMVAKEQDKKKILKEIKTAGNKLGDKDLAKVEVYYWDHDNVATRKSIDTSFTNKQIETVTDSGIRKILENHLAQKKGDPELAFSPEGIDDMNRNIAALNGGVPHKPILKVRMMDAMGNKYSVGSTGNKVKKFVVADKGTNLFFGIYVDENGKRIFETIPLNVVIERQMQGLPTVSATNIDGDKLLFSLSPNDLVYVPPSDGNAEVFIADALDTSNLYRIVRFSNGRLYGLPHSVAVSIVNKFEFTGGNELEATLGGQSIKAHCIKVSLDRLGNIKRISK